jgi:hypothetical protein
MRFTRKRVILLISVLLVVIVLVAGVVAVRNIINRPPPVTYTLAWHFYNIAFPDETIALTPLKPAHSLTTLSSPLSLDFSVLKTYSSLKLDTSDGFYSCVRGDTPLLFADKAQYPGLYLAVFPVCGQIAQVAGGAGLQPQLARSSYATHLFAMFTFPPPPCSKYDGPRPGEQPTKSFCLPPLNGAAIKAPPSALDWDIQNPAYANQVIPLATVTPPRPLSALTNLIRVTLVTGAVSFVTTAAAYQCDVGVTPQLFEDKVEYPALFIVAYRLCDQGKVSTDPNLYALFTFATPACSVDYTQNEACFFFDESPATPTPVGG